MTIPRANRFARCSINRMPRGVVQRHGFSGPVACGARGVQAAQALAVRRRRGRCSPSGRPRTLFGSIRSRYAERCGGSPSGCPSRCLRWRAQRTCGAGALPQSQGPLSVVPTWTSQASSQSLIAKIALRARDLGMSYKRRSTSAGTRENPGCARARARGV
jgi:hypothetical protein